MTDSRSRQQFAGIGIDGVGLPGHFLVRLPLQQTVADLLLRVDPGNAQELRDRGLLYASMDCYSLAVADLAAFLERVPGSPEAAALEERIEALRRMAARLN